MPIHNMFKTIKTDIKRLLINVYETSAYHWLKSRDKDTGINKIVFVCKGNICRSAFAEYLMRTEMNGRAIQVESCGLSVQKGTPAPPEAKKAAKRFGLDMEGHLSKGFDQCRFDDADLILAMEFHQYRKLVALFPHLKGKIKLLREFSSFPSNLLCNIDDPYGHTENRFLNCFSLIHESIVNLNRKLA